MPVETTASLIIWPGPSVAGPGAHLRLQENFRPIWTHRSGVGGCPAKAVALPSHGLATALALHLAATAQHECLGGVHVPADRQHVRLNAHHEHQLFRVFADTAATLLRFETCCISDRELRCAARCGFDVELVDLAAQRSRPDRSNR